MGNVFNTGFTKKLLGEGCTTVPRLCNEFMNVFLVKSKKISYNEVFSGKLAESTRNKNLLDEFVCKYEQLGMPQGWNVRIFLFMKRLLKRCCIT